MATLSSQELRDLFHSYLEQSRMDKQERLNKNRRNMEAYRNEQDFSYKRDDQSKEFIPKTFIAVEMIAKFILKAIQDAGGKFFSVETGKTDIDPEVARAFLSAYLENIGPNGESFIEILEDAIKFGLLKGEMIANVTGSRFSKPKRTVYGMIDAKPFHPVISIIDPDHYFPDTSKRGLFEILESERDFHELMELADAGIYIRSRVEDLQKAGKNERQPIKVYDIYGTFLKNGKVVARNAIATIAEDKVIRRITPNPFWHSESPFVRMPITRCPGERNDQAIMDSVVELNYALNELANLIIDGGVGAAIGARITRPGLLEDPRDALGGISHGSEIRMRSDVPPGFLPVEHIKLGEVPQESIALFAAINQMIVEASLQNDIALGRAPPKEATATEIVQLTRTQSILMSGLVAAVERFISKALKKLWMILMQNFEFLESDDVISAIGMEEALRLSRIPPEERFDMFSGIGLRVTGISDFIRRDMDLKSLVGFVQFGLSKPSIAQAFMQRFDMFKILNQVARFSGIDLSQTAMSTDQQKEIESLFLKQLQSQAIQQQQNQQQQALQ